MSRSTIVWISGATEGLGLGLARTCPYDDARIINLSRRPHPDLESVRFDLTEPSTWASVAGHFENELAAFKVNGRSSSTTPTTRARPASWVRSTPR